MSPTTPAEVQQQIQELTALRARTRRWQIGTTLALVAIIVGGVATIINAIAGLAKDGPQQKQFVGELQKGLNQQVVPELKQIAERTMNDVKRDVEKELQRVNERSPELIQALNKEVLNLQNNLPQRGEKILQMTLGRELKSREQKIKGMFPQVTDQKVATLVANLVRESEASMQHLSLTLFGGHLKALTGITDHIDTIKRTEPLNPQEDIATWETALLVVDILREDLKQLETQSAATNTTKKAATPAAKEAK